jgi:hypothetical protein
MTVRLELFVGKASGGCVCVKGHNNEGRVNMIKVYYMHV